MFPTYYRGSSSWIGLGPWSASPWGAPYVVGHSHDRQSLRRSQRVGEDAQSQGLGFTPPSTGPGPIPIQFPKPTFPGAGKMLYDKYAAEESSRRKRAVDLETARRWAEAAAVWRLAASSADGQAALAADRPDLDLEKGVTVKAAARAAGYRSLAQKDDALALGALLSPNGKNLFGQNGAYLGDAPEVPPDPLPSVPLWTWLVAGAAAVYGVARYVL